MKWAFLTNFTSFTWKPSKWEEPVQAHSTAEEAHSWRGLGRECRQAGESLMQGIWSCKLCTPSFNLGLCAFVGCVAAAGFLDMKLLYSPIWGGDGPYWGVRGIVSSVKEKEELKGACINQIYTRQWYRGGFQNNASPLKKQNIHTVVSTWHPSKSVPSQPPGFPSSFPSSWTPAQQAMSSLDSMPLTLPMQLLSPLVGSFVCPIYFLSTCQDLLQCLHVLMQMPLPPPCSLPWMWSFPPVKR